MKNHLHALKRIESEYPERHSGRSTAQALRLISDCIKNPGVWHGVHDHHGTNKANENLYYMCQQYVTLLNLHYFKFTMDDRGIYKIRSDHMEGT